MKLKTLATGSKGNLYLIQTESGDLLIEAGLPIKKIKQKLNFNFNNILGCLITHEHGDHAKSIQDIAELGIDVYTSNGTVTATKTNHYRYNIIEAKKEFKIGDFKILPFDIQHDSLEPLGFLIEYQGKRLLFATDTYYLKYKFANLTHIAIECNYVETVIKEKLENKEIHISQVERLLKSHMSLENCIEFLKANDLSKVEEMHLIHLSERNSDIEIIEREIKKVYRGKLKIGG